MFTPVQTVKPATKPVTSDDAKAWLHVDGSDEDALIGALVDAAIAYLDGWSGILGRCLITQTWRQDFSSWAPSSGPGQPVGACGGSVLRLPFPNVQPSGLALTYYDGENAQQTVDAADYTLIEDARGSVLQFASSWSAPSLYDRPDAVRVTFTAGYGDAATDVPADIRQAILLMVGAWYANREEIAPAGTALLPFGAQALLAKYRRVGL